MAVASADFIANVRKLIDQRREAAGASVQPVRPVEEQCNPYFEAAAVLAWYDPETLNPAEGAPDKAALSALLADSTPMIDGTGRKHWTISSAARLRTLRQLRAKDAVRRAMAANTPPDDALQQALTAYLSGNAPPLEAWDASNLPSIFQVIGWLGSAGFEGLPSPQAVGRRTDWLNFLEPFEHLIGPHFRGRVDELKRIRDYIEVFAPSSALAYVRRKVGNFLSLTSKPPLHIHGPGGVGKSTLIAKLIVEHARALERDQFPFVYLDFDRPEISSQQPLSLLVEAVRQIGIQYPDAQERCESLRGRWLADLSKRQQMVSAKSDALHDSGSSNLMDRATHDFATLIATLNANDRPVLLVLDTFEEVQYRSDQEVTEVWRLLEILQPRIPRLRVVIAGRAELADWKIDDMPLDDLDDEAAIGYLQHRGISDAKLARRLVQQVGGSPLSLKLAAEVAIAEHLDGDGTLPINTREYLFFRVSAEAIQRQLYKRILSHIHNEDVKRLAHPGLVLRRLTADIIQHVLAVPCEIPIDTPEAAAKLFDELRREVSLVSAERNGVLRHREDLRRLMLGLIDDDEPDKVRLINENAVAYYEGRSGDAEERAEEIYHRLRLDQDLGTIDKRWIPGVDRYLKNAPSEFGGRLRAYLARRLNIEVDQETRELADLEDWERLVDKGAAQSLALGRPEDALKLLQGRSERSPASPLFIPEARANVMKGEPLAGLEVLDFGFAAAAEAGEHRQMLALALESADVALAYQLKREGIQLADRMRELAKGDWSEIDLLEILSRLLALMKMVSEPETDPISRRAAMLFDQLADRELHARPAAARWAGATIEPPDSRILGRVFRLAGVPQEPRADVRSFAATIAAFDAGMLKNRKSSTISRELGLPQRDSLTTTWTEFLLEGSNEARRLAVGRLMADWPVSAAVVAAGAALLGAALGLFRAGASSTSGPTERRTVSSVSPRQKEALVDALCKAFARNELYEFVASRLEQRLEAVSSAHVSYRQTVFELVETAHREAWLDRLVENALEARRGNAALIEVASDLGFSTLASDSLEAVVRSSPMSIDPSLFAARLGDIQSWVCLVEVDGKIIATGFLVGLDLVLTAEFVLRDVLNGNVSSEAVSLRFDYRTVDQEVKGGTIFRVGKDSILASNSESSYALLRTIQPVGAFPVGGAASESMALPRRWFEIARAPIPPAEGETLFIVSHAKGMPMQLSTGTLKSIDQDDRIFRYDNLTEPGSSGAPVLAADLRLVGMHLGGQLEIGQKSKMNFGVLISSIREDLERNGLGVLIGQALA
jgi:hypothetical protein